ncbi:MAG TPA: fused MFS/spermidine synthase [Pyrinomonadaceae bacterium]|nr:fused MFS/spermidine synthase [Pyrinomonadaceae bacterium]
MSKLFAVTLFLSALLLFWVQPLVGKMLLPLLGGTPSVWNTCLLFFQSALLAGYAYVLASTRKLSTRAQAVLHVALLVAAAAALPAAFVGAASNDPTASPVAWLLKTLLLTVGLPFFALSASAPLLQKWYSQTRAASASDPYFLYAASNAGSLAALLAFPTLLEPNLTLGQQARAWSLGYLALVLLVVVCACAALGSLSHSLKDKARDDAQAVGETRATNRVVSERLTLGRRMRWVLLAFAPSSLVLGVTTYITTDIVAVPLLWVVPLALYLLSFVLVFARRQLLSRHLLTRALPGAAVLVVLVYLSGATQPAWFLILFHLAFLFAAAMVCHGQLANDRPAARHLAEFYLWLAVGGALGGLFNAVVAPLVFNSVVEYPLVIVLACYLRPAFRRERGQLLGLRLGARKARGEDEDENRAVEDVGEADTGEPRADWLDLLPPLCIGVLAAALALVVTNVEMKTVERVAVSLGLPLFLLNYFFAPRPLRFAVGVGAVMLASAFFSGSSGRTLSAERNFFGTVRVIEAEGRSGWSHYLRHGSTLHGRQFTDPTRECEPLTYYHRAGPLGSVFSAFDAKPDTARGVAVVGLGAGTSAAYSRAGEAWTFYEIDPAVVRVARDPASFTYLSKCAAAPVAVVLGDARLRLRDAPASAYGLIVLDAFSSDSVPAHLLTREALALYLSKLAPGGVVAYHVSNRSLELERVVGGLAADAGLVARVFADKEYDPDAGRDPSTWCVVARKEEDLGALATDARWQPLDARGYKLELWRDDFSNVVTLFK